jgi:hypothetical protein
LRYRNVSSEPGKQARGPSSGSRSGPLVRKPEQSSRASKWTKLSRDPGPRILQALRDSWWATRRTERKHDVRRSARNSLPITRRSSIRRPALRSESREEDGERSTEPTRWAARPGGCTEAFRRRRSRSEEDRPSSDDERSIGCGLAGDRTFRETIESCSAIDRSTRCPKCLCGSGSIGWRVGQARSPPIEPLSARPWSGEG